MQPIKNQVMKLKIQQIIALSFIGWILLGSLILYHPISTNPPAKTTYIDALFTSTSATCVTGLVVVDTATHFSFFGQLVTLILLQVGGLGIITFATLAIIATRNPISYKFGLILKEGLNRLNLENIKQTVLKIIKITFLIEAIGAILLFITFSKDFTFKKAIWASVYHSISAFCNAGFSVFSKNLVEYKNNINVNFVITTLIILGGIGFTVLLELINFKSKRKLSVHSKFTIFFTVCLIITGTLFIFLIETYSPTVTRGNSWIIRLLTSYFHSVSARTAGFNTLNISKYSTSVLLFLILLMFIGASPGGTGGGIKTTTFGIIVAFLISTMKGENEVHILKRRISNDTILRAFTIICLSVILIVSSTIIMTLLKDRSLIKSLFEVTSAFGTVGLSTGITPNLTSLEKIIIILTMFCGRVGPLTLAIALADKPKISRIHFPETQILVG